MQQRECPFLPSRPTINRILKRHGVLVGRRRKRWTPPPTGWYLKPLAKKLAELDQFDYIEDLCIAGGTPFQVLNVISLHGNLADSFPPDDCETYSAKEERILAKSRLAGLCTVRQLNCLPRRLLP
jgi:hypothetical protein